MPISLTYNLRTGLITGVVAGQRLQLLAQPSQGSVYDWQKLQELRVGAVTLSDHSFELPSSTPVTSTGAVRIGSGSTNTAAVHRSPSITITGSAGGFHIHGWPPCDLAGCLVISRGWEELSRALAREQEHSIDFYVAR